MSSFCLLSLSLWNRLSRILDFVRGENLNRQHSSLTKIQVIGERIVRFLSLSLSLSRHFLPQPNHPTWTDDRWCINPIRCCSFKSNTANSNSNSNRRRRSSRRRVRSIEVELKALKESNGSLRLCPPLCGKFLLVLYVVGVGRPVVSPSLPSTLTL
jgi:hypothetical protein